MTTLTELAQQNGHLPLGAKSGTAARPQPDETTKVCDLFVALQGGQILTTSIYDEDLEEEDVESVEELIEKALTQPTRPHWAWLGDIHFYTQVVSGVQVR